MQGTGAGKAGRRQKKDTDGIADWESGLEDRGSAGKERGLERKERVHAVEEPVGGDLPIKRHSARLSDLGVVL